MARTAERLMPEGGPGNGTRRAHRLLQKSFHGGCLLRSGETVWLHDHEIGSHHELTPDMAEPAGEIAEPARPNAVIGSVAPAAPAPATQRRPRRRKAPGYGA